MLEEGEVRELEEYQYLIIANKPIEDNDISDVEFWDGNFQWISSWEECAKFKDFELWEEMMDSIRVIGHEPYPVISETTVEQIPDGRWAVMVHYADMIKD